VRGYHLIVTVVLLSGCFSGPRYQGPVSDHFDGEQFVNATKRSRPGYGDMVTLATSRKPGPWYPGTRNQAFPSPPRRVGRGALRVTFVNHATTLVQMDGLNILTDPIYSERCSPVEFAGPKRVRPPGIPASLRSGALPSPTKIRRLGFRSASAFRVATSK